MATCAVCLEETRGLALPCMHSICRPCGARWFALHSTCPMCRGHLTGFREQGEQGEQGGAARADTVRAIHVSIAPGGHAGVTVDRCGARGLYVKRLDKRDFFSKSGVRVGDRLLEINGLALSDATAPDVAIAVVEENRRRGCDMRLLVEERRRRWCAA